MQGTGVWDSMRKRVKSQFIQLLRVQRVVPPVPQKPAISVWMHMAREFCGLALWLLGFHHETDCAQSPPKAVGSARLIGHADFVMLISRRYKIDEGGIKINIV